MPIVERESARYVAGFMLKRLKTGLTMALNEDTECKLKSKHELIITALHGIIWRREC